MHPSPFRIEEWSSVHCYVYGPADSLAGLAWRLREAGLVVTEFTGYLGVYGYTSTTARTVDEFRKPGHAR